MPPVVRRTSDAVPLVPVQRWSIELPATTVGERQRRRSLRRHKGGLWTVFLTSCHKCCCSVAFKCQASCAGGGQSPRYRRRIRTLDYPFNFLPPRFVAGWLLSVTFKVSPYLTKYWSGLHPKLEGREADSCRSDGRATTAWHKRGHGHAREGR